MNPGITEDLKNRWTKLREEEPKLRIRDAAQKLGVSEAELLATQVGETATRLQGPWENLLGALPKLGPVMCLTRNEAAVHERHGKFRQIDFFHGMGQVVGPDIDLRIFMNEFHIGFAVQDPTPEGPRRSLQFFDKSGTAIHKVYLQEGSDVAAYDAIIAESTSPNQETLQDVTAADPARPELPDAEIDAEGFRAAWRAMKDTHEFFILLRKFRVSRTQALRLAEPEFAKQLTPAAATRTFELAAERDVPIMVFVSSPGVIQIHTGPVKNLKVLGPWFNVLDEEFNLHLRADLVASVWMVRKPTTDGIVTSIELYDSKGENIALLFGKRKPGTPELEVWRTLAADVAAA